MKVQVANAFQRDSAPYVVLHALARKTRGRSPAATFGDIRNPREALEEALKVWGEVILEPGGWRYVPPPGLTNLSKVAREIDPLVQALRAPVTTTFAGITVVGHPGYQLEDTNRAFTLEIERELSQLVVNLRTLDFTDYNQLLSWFYGLSLYTCLANDSLIGLCVGGGVRYDWERVVDVFCQHGFQPYDATPNHRLPNHVEGDDPVAAAHVIIGMALADVASSNQWHAVRPLVREHYAEWQARFAKSER